MSMSDSCQLMLETNNFLLFCILYVVTSNVAESIMEVTFVLGFTFCLLTCFVLTF